MDLMGAIFGPFERYGMTGGLILFVIVSIISGVIAAYLIAIGVTLLAGIMFVITSTLTYGLLTFFLYVMWYRRPK